MSDAYISQLIKLLEQEMTLGVSFEDKGYTSSKEANNLIFSEPIAFLLGLIFDQGMKSSLAWMGPCLLRERLGHLDVERISCMELDDLKEIIARPKAIHRYPGMMARNIISACQRIQTAYSGSFSFLSMNARHILVVKRDLLSIKGIGEKKANLAILLLARDFGVEFKGIDELPLAVDVHLYRVLRRSGYFGSDLVTVTCEANRRFKEKYSEFPAKLGLMLWLVGRRFCSESNPGCIACPLSAYCGKEISP